MSEQRTSNLKLCADLRMVAEQLDRPDGWGRAALSARAAIAAIECMESELDDAAFMMKTLVSQGDREIKHLRSALEQIRVLALHETYGSSAGYKGIADRLAGELLKVTTIAREALRGAVPAEEIPAGEPKPLPAHIGAAPAPSYQRRGGGCEPPGSAVETDAHHHQCPHCGTMWNDLTGRQAVPIPCKCKADKTS